MQEVFVVPTGVGNMASVEAAFGRLDRRLRLVAAAEQVDQAEFLVLPGVGNFAAARAGLEAAGLVPALRRRVAAGRPTLAICLGMQLLCAASAEAPGTPGLGAVVAEVQGFESGLRSPHMGWADVSVSKNHRFLQAGTAYFAHSFVLRAAPPGWETAWAQHGGSFVAAMERDGVLACQFHPELSGAFGASLLRRWLAGGAD